LKVAKAWTKEDLDKWLVGFEKELREMVKDGMTLREDGSVMFEKTWVKKIREILGE